MSVFRPGPVARLPCLPASPLGSSARAHRVARTLARTCTHKNAHTGTHRNGHRRSTRQRAATSTTTCVESVLSLVVAHELCSTLRACVHAEVCGIGGRSVLDRTQNSRLHLCPQNLHSNSAAWRSWFAHVCERVRAYERVRPVRVRTLCRFCLCD